MSVCVCIFTPVIRYAKRMFSAQHHTVICDPSGSNIFSPHVTSKSHGSSEKKLMNTNFVFGFSLQPLSETFPILRRCQRSIKNNVYRY